MDHERTFINAKSDAEALMNAVLPFAAKMLAEHSEFFPYGAAMKPNGEIVSIAGYDGREQPPSQQIIDLLYSNLRRDASNEVYKTTAVVYDVRLTLPGRTATTDAIAVALEHRDDYSVVVMFPYSLTGGTVSIGEPFAEKGPHRIFPR
jgi:hypothetical protein